MVRTLKPNELKTYLADFDIEFYEETQGTADRGSGMPHRPHARLEEVLRSEPVGHQHISGAAAEHNLSTIDWAPHPITFIISQLKR